MINFADGQKPPVLSAITAAQVPCVKTDDGTPLFFSFNNSALFIQNLGNKDSFDEMFWNLGKRSMQQFFDHLDTMDSKSLLLTIEVLRERRQLEASVSGLKNYIKIGLQKLDEIKIRASLEQNQHVIKQNEKFEYEVDTIQKKVNTPRGRYAKNCSRCNFTCHYPCTIRKAAEKNRCRAFKNGRCKVCRGRCGFAAHHNMAYRILTTTVKEKRTYANLKKLYEEALGKKMSIENIIKQLEREHADVQNDVWRMTEKLAKGMTRLKEIALRPDPLSTPDYIEQMIEAERRSATDGYEKRIAELKEMLKNAEMLQKVEKGAAGVTRSGLFNNMETWVK